MSKKDDKLVMQIEIPVDVNRLLKIEKAILGISTLQETVIYILKKSLKKHEKRIK